MRYSAPGQYSLSIHEGAEADLNAIHAKDPSAANALEAFLGEVYASQDLLDRFSQDRFAGPAGSAWFDVSRFQSLWGRFNLWRVKLLYTPSRASAYRIVYAFHPGERRYYILAIVARNTFDYDESEPIVQRIIAVYRDLDIP